MKLTKEIDENNKNQEHLEKSLKDKSNECHKLNCQIGQMQLDIYESNHNEKEIEMVN